MHWLLIAVIVLLSGCGQMAAQKTMENAKSCANEVKTSQDGMLVFARLWADDDSDTARKLNDNAALLLSERDALIRVHKQLSRCRQIIVEHDIKFAPAELPYWEDLFARGDAIFTKLVSGELTVAQANKLTIESVAKFRSDTARGYAITMAAEEQRRQRASEALLMAGSQMLSRSQARTTNCSWVGNVVNCTSR